MKIRSICNGPGSMLPHNLGLIYGVEIELEQAGGFSTSGDPFTIGQWRAVSDGSLRNNGLELVSPPCDLASLEKTLPQIYTTIDNSGATGSVRTGTHVHINMLDLTVKQVLAICTSYALLEPALYATLERTREQGIYCVPWYRASGPAEGMRDCFDLANRRYGTARSYLNRTSKYTGLNVSSLTKFGTLEFRMAPTFATSEYLIEWIYLLTCIVESGLALGTPDAVLQKVARHGVSGLFNGLPDADALATKYDAYYVAEILAGVSNVSWDAPTLDFDELVPSGEGRTSWSEGLTVASTIDELLDDLEPPGIAIPRPRGQGTEDWSYLTSSDNSNILF